MRGGLHLLVGIALAWPTVAATADDTGRSVDERRLRACVTSGIGGAPRESLAASVVAVRALCGHQINVVRLARHHAISGDPATVEAMKADSDRRLNREIAELVARLTGLDG